MSSDFFPVPRRGRLDRRHGRRERTWREPRGLFRELRSFQPPKDRGLVVKAILSSVFLVMLVTTVVGVTAVYAAYNYFVRGIPPVGQVVNQPIAQTTKIYDRNGVLLATIVDPNQGRRVLVNLNQVPPYLIDATVAVEDPTFFSNPGISPQGIARALVQNFTHGHIESGASTLTQQLARNLLWPVQERESQSIDRKVKEMIFSIRLTQTYSKDQILTMYFNEVWYGNFSNGVGAAAESYFGKPVSQLDLAQSAMLAGLPQAPTSYDPIVHPKEAKARQAIVLDAMVRHGYITPQQAAKAYAEPLHYANPQFVVKAPHFVNYVTQWIEDRYGPDALYDRGWRIQTTLDYGLDQVALHMGQQRIAQVGNEMNVHNACIVTIQPQTGEILTLVGSLDYANKKIDGNVDVCISGRQPGSSIKVFNYVTAFERGYVPDSMVEDVRTSFPNGPGQPPYTPNNFDFTFHGNVMLREALASSLNIPAIKLLERVGTHDMVNTAHALGITTLTDPDRYGLTITLGTDDVKALDMAYAYSVFANGGQMVGEPVPLQDRVLGMRQYEPVAVLKITDSAGNVVYQYKPPKPIQVIDPRPVYLLTSSLTDDAARHFTFAPGGALVVGRPAAVKTGTTQLEQDAWTVGYTPNLAVAIWVGNTDGTPMNTTISVLTAGEIWHTYMTAAFAYLHLPVRDFQVPPGVTYGKVCGKNDWSIVGIPPICNVG